MKLAECYIGQRVVLGALHGVHGVITDLSPDFKLRIKWDNNERPFTYTTGFLQHLSAAGPSGLDIMLDFVS